MSIKRISREYSEIYQSPPEGLSVSLPNDSSVHTWHVTLTAPPTSPFHPGRFGVLLSLPVDYPFKPPVVKFFTRIYHPNVTNDALGNVCLGLLKPENWKPSTKIAGVLEAVMGLLLEPQPDDPLEEGIAEEYRNNREGWERTAKSFVSKYAMGDPKFPPQAT